MWKEVVEVFQQTGSEIRHPVSGGCVCSEGTLVVDSYVLVQPGLVGLSTPTMVVLEADKTGEAV